MRVQTRETALEKELQREVIKLKKHINKQHDRLTTAIVCVIALLVICFFQGCEQESMRKIYQSEYVNYESW